MALTSSSPAFRFSSAVNFRLPLQVPTEIDPKIKEAISPLYAALQQVFQAFVNNCGTDQQDQASWASLASQEPASTLLSGNLRRLYVVASENIAFGAMINLFSNAGVLNARNANSTNATKTADGFCTTSGGIVAGAVGEVQLSTGVCSINGLTIGQNYWLSATNGLVQAGPDTTAGHIEQLIGKAITTTQLYVNIAPSWIQH